MQWFFKGLLFSNNGSSMVTGNDLSCCFLPGNTRFPMLDITIK